MILKQWQRDFVVDLAKTRELYGWYLHKMCIRINILGDTHCPLSAVLLTKYGITMSPSIVVYDGHKLGLTFTQRRIVIASADNLTLIPDYNAELRSAMLEALNLSPDG